MTSIWIKRGAYLAASALSFVAMAVALQIIAIIADFQRWQFEYFVLNQYTGPIVMGSFVVILVFIGISMFFLFKAFTTVQADELPI